MNACDEDDILVFLNMGPLPPESVPRTAEQEAHDIKVRDHFGVIHDERTCPTEGWGLDYIYDSRTSILEPIEDQEASARRDPVGHLDRQIGDQIRAIDRRMMTMMPRGRDEDINSNTHQANRNNDPLVPTSNLSGAGAATTASPPRYRRLRGLIA